MEANNVAVPPSQNKPEVKVKTKIVLRNVLGKEMAEKDYFFSPTDDGKAQTNGMPLAAKDLGRSVAPEHFAAGLGSSFF